MPLPSSSPSFETRLHICWTPQKIANDPSKIFKMQKCQSELLEATSTIPQRSEAASIEEYLLVVFGDPCLGVLPHLTSSWPLVAAMDAAISFFPAGVLERGGSRLATNLPTLEAKK